MKDCRILGFFYPQEEKRILFLHSPRTYNSKRLMEQQRLGQRLPLWNLAGTEKSLKTGACKLICEGPVKGEAG